MSGLKVEYQKNNLDVLISIFLLVVSVFVIFTTQPISANDGFDEEASESESESLDSIKFEHHKWQRKLLSWIESGPIILPRDYDFNVAPPPANSSLATREEILYLHELSRTARDEATVETIIAENAQVPPVDLFKGVGLIHPENYTTSELFRLMDQDVGFFILERKFHFSRPRPNQIDPALTTVIPNPPHASYPSGHAGQSYITALVLSDFDPENEAVYKQFAYDIAHRREIAGVHYPSDTLAGRKLAVDVLAKLRENTVFEKKFQDAKISYIPPDKAVVEPMREAIAARMKERGVHWSAF